MSSNRDYQAIADAVRLHTSREDLISRLVGYFADAHPRFDEKRFRQACEPVEPDGLDDSFST